MSEDRMNELDDLLGAYALDAVTDDERRAIEDYLRVNPRARHEVEEHREVASMLAWSGTQAPDGLWDRIASNLEETPPAPSGELASVLALDPARRDRPRRSWRTTLPWALTGAAAAVIAVLAVTVVRLADDDGSQSGLAAAVEEARADPGSRTATLMSPDGDAGAEAIIDPDGHGFLVVDALPALSPDRTWQLWGVIEGEAISLGVLGHAPEIEVFTVDGDVEQLIVTNEVAGGVITGGNPDGAYGGPVG